MNYFDITKKSELQKKEGPIARLFAESFGKPLSVQEWRWFYIDNPIGDPFVSLYYEGENLLGHYAVVPTLLSFQGCSFVAYRSMTTMVHPAGRGKGLFTELARRVYGLLEECGASMVYGFPNQNSAPGFVKNLGWTLLPSDRVCDFNGADLIDNPVIRQALLTRAEIEWDSIDMHQSRWRTAMPGAIVEKKQGLVTKEYQGVHNILHLSDQGVGGINEFSRYRALIPSGYFADVPECVPVFDYQFGYRVFDNQFEGASFKRELIMSDVF